MVTVNRSDNQFGNKFQYLYKIWPLSSSLNNYFICIFGGRSPRLSCFYIKTVVRKLGTYLKTFIFTLDDETAFGMGRKGNFSKRCKNM